MKSPLVFVVGLPQLLLGFFAPVAHASYCPETQPSQGNPCDHDGLECVYGTDVCCGESHDSDLSICENGVWQHVIMDACNQACPCPVERPNPRDECFFLNQECIYDSEPCCGDNVATEIAICDTLGWQIRVPALICDNCDPCPDTQPANDTPCPQDGLQCVYGTATCCGENYDTDISICDEATGWKQLVVDACFTPCPTPCPINEPDPGASCPENGQECVYGTETCCGSSHDTEFAFCFGGEWQIVPIADVCFFPPGGGCPARCPEDPPSTDFSSLDSCPTAGQKCDYFPQYCCGKFLGHKVQFTCDFGPFGLQWIPAIASSLPVCPPCGGDVDMDPHFRTWASEWFDYHGVCDMMFLHSPDFGEGLGLRIHIRTKGRFQYSFIETAAVKIGEDVLEVSSFGDYMLNGVASAELEEVLLGGRYGVSHINQSKKRHTFTITIAEEEQVVLTTFKDMVGVHLKGASFSNFGNSIGLMGNYTTGQKLSRDRLTAIEDPAVFGQEWQVLQSEPKLFHILRDPQQPMECVIPTEAEGRRLGQTLVSKEEAEKACEPWGTAYKQFCVIDVLATQDLEAAEAGPGAF